LPRFWNVFTFSPLMCIAFDQTHLFAILFAFNLIIWHSKLTCCCGPSSNFVVQATIKILLMMMML